LQSGNEAAAGSPVTEAAAIESIAPFERREAQVLARDEYERFVVQLRSLDRPDWDCLTDCSPWSVRDMATHVLGACLAIGSAREMAHQVRAGRRLGGNLTDAINAVQIDERRALTPAEILQAFPVAAARSIRARARIPSIIRRFRWRVELPTGVRERWRLGFLLDVIYTRDAWMHRIDIARATGRPPELSSEHDGRIVADLAADWARRHGRPVDISLTGPAGGRFRSGIGGEEIQIDAIAFARALSGRDAPSDGLLSIYTPF
jgi:uncharacterized protein (TIGR03083 family)